MTRWILVGYLLAQAPGVDPNAPLPPGHPPVGGSTAPLPAGHPPLGPAATPPMSVDPNAPLPAGHPPLPGAEARPPAELPPGHPAVAADQKPMSSTELLKKLDGTPDLKTREKTFEVAVALGKLYYANARYVEAVTYLRQALAKAEPNRALLLDARRVLASALFLTGDAAGALAELDQAVTLDDRDAEAAFLRGAMRLDAKGDDVKALELARSDLQRAVALAPNGPRARFAHELAARAAEAIAAGGIVKLDQKRALEAKARPLPAVAPAAPFAPFAGGGGAGVPALTQDQIDAVQNTERTPELDQGLAKLVEEGEAQLARGQYQDALDTYKRVVPFQPQNGRAKAGMAWSLEGLGKPMADRVWTVAVQSDPGAVDKLGDTLQAKGDAKGARALWQKLAQTDPDYAKRSGLSAKLQ